MRQSLNEELNGGNHANNGTSNGTPTRGKPTRPATKSQVKALFAITKSQRLNLNDVVHHRFGVGRADDLSISEASELIDELKNGR